MGLNKQKGNMYGFVTHTWNPIKGRCPHNCNYCYMHRYWGMMENDKFRLDEKELETNLGEGNFIFVGSSTDMWLGKTEWISKVLTHIAKYPKNQYLFQTKAPINYEDWTFYDNQILAITLETDYILSSSISKAHSPKKRVEDFIEIPHNRKMVTIEPIMYFHHNVFLEMIKKINPFQVNVGADTSGKLRNIEPDPIDVRDFIKDLTKFTKVHQKPNLKRITNE